MSGWIKVNAVRLAGLDDPRSIEEVTAARFGAISRTSGAAPPKLGELSGLMELFFKGGESTSSGLGRAYQTV